MTYTLQKCTRSKKWLGSFLLFSSIIVKMLLLIDFGVKRTSKKEYKDSTENHQHAHHNFVILSTRLHTVKVAFLCSFKINKTKIEYSTLIESERISHSYELLYLMKIQSVVYGFWDVWSEYPYVYVFSYLWVYFAFQTYVFQKRSISWRVFVTILSTSFYISA